VLKKKPYQVRIYLNTNEEIVMDVFVIKYSPSEGMAAFIELQETTLIPMAHIKMISISAWNASGDFR
jgi:hypothetical protein